ncbi:MAG: DUF2190 domain-containing protein [Deltaproteobacteria bacterium]|nr:DUF2190 domain-containing protein [Deltaproteobacteria bacterium]
MGQTSGLEKSVKCTAVLATANLIAKFGADDDTLSQATASTEELVGVFQHTTSAVGEEVRVMLDGITRVVLGGTVVRGNYLTSDANGKAVAAAPAVGVNAYVIGQALASGAAAPAVGVNAYVIGQALASGVAGDIIPMHIEKARIQG